MALEHLKFFDKKGNNITPILDDSGVFKFDLYFDRISTNLFETQSIYIFEEVLKNVTRVLDAYDKVPNLEPIEIKILNHLSGKTKVAEKELAYFFDIQTLGENYVADFVLQRPNYIQRFWENDEFWESITQQGQSYLDEYLKNVNDKKNKDYGWDTRITRPRANIEDELSEAFLFFKWENIVNDDKIFTFEVNNLDDTIYYRNDKAICKDDGKKYPSIIKFSNNDLVLSNYYNNGTIRDFFKSKYSFDNGFYDGLEDPIYTKTFGYLEDGSFGLIMSPDLPAYKKRRKLAMDSELGIPDVNNQKINSNPLTINIAINSDTEGVFTRKLNVFFIRKTPNYVNNIITYVENVYQIAEINFHGEVIGADERLPKILENFGRKIDQNDFYIFKEADIDDDNLDQIFINDKYKELLLVGDEIFPYMGTYKAFNNALKWLGYQDLTVREYFYNIGLSDLSKNKTVYTAVDLPKELSVPDNLKDKMSWQTWVYGDLLENDNFIKTTRLGLVYPMNTFTGEWDEYGYPIMEDNYTYSADEFLIKLYGLKNILQKYFLPHHARIIDITAEGIYFVKYQILTSSDFDRLIDLRQNSTVDFHASPLSTYLHDLNILVHLYKSVFGISESSYIGDSIKKFKNIPLKFVENNKLLMEPTITPEITSNINTRCQFAKGEPCCNANINYEYYIDEDTGYMYKKDYSNEYTKVKCGNYSNKCYWQFIADLKQMTYDAFEDTNVITLDKIIKSYPTLDLLINSLNEQIYKYWATYNEKNISHKSIYNHTLTGAAINLVLDPKAINWKDLRISWKELLYIAPEDPDRSKLYSWDGLKNYQGQIIKWIVREYLEDAKNYVKGQIFEYTIEGDLETYSDCIIFLPKTGKYDVTCEVTDIINSRKIKTKRQYIEVKNRVYDFYALGRKHIKKYNTWEDLEKAQPGVTFNDITGNWNGIYLKDNVTFDFWNTKLPWLKLYYTYYKNQNFLKDYINYSDILDIDKINNKVTLKGDDFYKKYTEYNEQYHGKTLTFEKDYLDNLFYKVDSFSNNRTSLLINAHIDLLNKNNIFSLSQIKTIDATNFIINDNQIILRTKFYDYFQIGDFIHLKYSGKYYIYKIKTIDFNIIDNLIYLTVDNDGSLTYINENVTSTSLNKFEKLEVQKNPVLLNVINSYYGENGKGTYIEFEYNSFLNKALRNTEDWYIEIEPTIGELTYNIDKVEQLAQNTIVTFKDSVCNLSVAYKAKWVDEFEYIWSKKYNNSFGLTWKNSKTLTWDDMKGVSYNQLIYNEIPRFGFTITKVDVGSGIKINNDLLMFDLKNIIPNTTSMMREVLKQLRNSSLKNFLDFDYYLNNNIIKAVSKVNSLYSLKSITGISGCYVSKNNIPNLYFNRWNKIFFEGYNKTPNWNYTFKFLTANNEFRNDLDDENIYDEVIENTELQGFLNENSYITNIRANSKQGTTIFFTAASNKDFDNSTKFEWELWDETRSIMLTKSKKDYFIWNFIEPGIYSVTMYVNKYGSITKVQKKGFVKISL